MKWRIALVLLAGWLVAGRAAAQDEEFTVKDRNLIIPVRDGQKTFRDSPGIDDAIKHAARWSVMRLTDPANKSLKAGSTQMHTLVSEASNLMVNPAVVAP